MSEDFATADLCDDHPGLVEVCDPVFQDFGGTQAFLGSIETVKVFEDNVLVRQTLETPGEGRVLVVDGGGSTRRALVGELVAQLAVENGWAGLLLYGSVRDTAQLLSLPVGIKALAATPRRSDKDGAGRRGDPVRFAGVLFESGDWLYADGDGVVVAPRAVHLDRPVS
jgi:regulator of ribonuclease activity A